MVCAIWGRVWFWLSSQDRNAMPQPVLSGSWSVGGLVDPVRHAVLGPLRGGGEVGEGVVADGWRRTSVTVLRRCSVRTAGRSSRIR